MLDGLRGEDSIAELCRREGIALSLYYSGSKAFLEAGKKRLAGDTAHLSLGERWFVSGARRVQALASGGHGCGTLGYGIRVVEPPCGSRIGRLDSDLYAVAPGCRSWSRRSGRCPSTRAVGLSGELRLTPVSRV